ncbi:MAG: hypothetical protein HYS56_04300 [Candidatus Omnitrophica bacterium]|nr:hypothetical protein [Candidatus Omnitrophota bacterium]
MVLLRIKRLLPALFLVVLSLGCASTTSGTRADGPVKELGVASALKFDDVPIPVGFRILPDQSFSFQNELTRVGILRYAGRANAQRVIQFYKDQMPMYNWQFVNMIEYDRSLINFEKADQVCTITIEGGVTKTGLVIAVAPKGSQFHNSSSAAPHKQAKELQ